VLVKALEGKGPGPTGDGVQSQESRESPFEAVFVTRRSWRREVCALSLSTDWQAERDMSHGIAERERDVPASLLALATQARLWPAAVSDQSASPSLPSFGFATSRGRGEGNDVGSASEDVFNDVGSASEEEDTCHSMTSEALPSASLSAS
jgi:hypothetical protein